MKRGCSPPRRMRSATTRRGCQTRMRMSKMEPVARTSVPLMLWADQNCKLQAMRSSAM
jgi:hypothetical protein